MMAKVKDTRPLKACIAASMGNFASSLVLKPPRPEAGGRVGRWLARQQAKARGTRTRRPERREPVWQEAAKATQGVLIDGVAMCE